MILEERFYLKCNNSLTCLNKNANSRPGGSSIPQTHSKLGFNIYNCI
uniref:Uncharacterized protein n=1 Tax=Picea glauca TaxID=3330 RepID=A0A101M446_PICGL|nr:hypothetical protein ABT39_MTgene318 [Picea glauca]